MSGIAFTFRDYATGERIEVETFDLDSDALAFGDDLAERVGVDLSVSLELGSSREHIGNCIREDSPEHFN